MPDGYLISVGVKADFSELKAEQKAAQDAVKAATENMKVAYSELGQAAERGSVQAVEALKIYENELAQAEAKAALAGQALARAHEAVGQSAEHIVPASSAAAGALRDLELKFDQNIRAAERFLTTTLGLGPALQAAFPIVGALALGGVIYELGKKVTDFSIQAADLATELGTGWLAGAVGQLNGLKEAVEQVDTETLKLAGTVDALKNKSAQANIENIRLTQGSAAAYRAEAKEKLAQADALEKGLRIARQLNEETTKRSKATQPIAAEGVYVGDEPTVDALKASKELEQSTEDIKSYQLQINTLKKEAANLDLQADQVKGPKAPKAAKEPKNTYDPVRDMLADDTRAQAQSERETNAIREYGLDLYKQEADAIKAKMAADEEDAKQKLRSGEIDVENAAKLAEAQVQLKLATGAITQQAASHELAAIHAKEYADKIALLNEYLTTLGELQSKGGNFGKEIDATLNDKKKTEGEAKTTGVTDAAKSAAPFQKAWAKAFQDVGRQFMNVQDQILRGQISIVQGAKRMGSELLMDAIHFGERELIQNFGNNARKLAAKTATNTAMLAEDAGAAQADITITRSAALQAAFIHAKLSAVKAFDWASGWGGPIAGAIAAAGAFTGAMAWAAFEQGGVVGGSIGSAVPVLAHAGERILTVDQTRSFHQMLSLAGGGGSGGTTIHNGGNTFNGVADARTFQKMLAKHERSVAMTVKKSMRNGRF